MVTDQPTTPRMATALSGLSVRRRQRARAIRSCFTPTWRSIRSAEGGSLSGILLHFQQAPNQLGFKLRFEGAGGSFPLRSFLELTFGGLFHL